MSIFSRLFKRSTKEPVSQEDLARFLKGGANWTGVDVGRASVMGQAAVWASIRVLSENLASLPLILYRRTADGGKERATDHPLYSVLHDQPNPENSPFIFKEVLEGHVTLLGNAYAQIVSGGGGQVSELWPLNPEKMEVKRVNGRLVYKYTQSGKVTLLRQDQVFHIPGLGFDGISGYSPLDLLANSFGLSIASHQYGARFFENYAAPGGYIQMQGRLKDVPAIERFKATWEDAHKDWSNKHRIAILEDGAEWKSITIPPEHAQFIETRKLTTSDIARIFRVPPHMIGDLEKATFSNIEQQSIEFVVYTMRPWLVRWEQAVNTQLLLPADRSTYFAEFLVDALLRGDAQARWAAYRTAREIGALTADEIRQRENMNPVPEGQGGDDFYVPLNWIKTGTEPEEPEDEEPEPEDEQNAVREQRGQRAATTRFRIAESHRELFRQSIARIMRREEKEIKAAAKKFTARGLGDFELWSKQFYSQELPKYVRQVMLPVFTSLAENIKVEVGDEIGVDQKLTPEDENFIGAYNTIYSQRHAGRSAAMLQNTIDGAVEEQVDVEEEINKEIDRWQSRPTEEAANETVKGSNAFAKNQYLLAGIIFLRWVALGPKTCPYCAAMDGRVVGINSQYALPHDVIETDDGKLDVQHSCGHPPLHSGCVCQIVSA